MPKAVSEIAMTTQEKLEELQETLDMFADPASRADLLIGFADKFKDGACRDRDAALPEESPGAAVRVRGVRVGRR